MNQPVEDLREMLLAVTRSLVDQPDKLRIDSVCEDETVAFLVLCASQDAGTLIGANGRTARALRIILQANAVKLQLKPVLNICALSDIPTS